MNLPDSIREFRHGKPDRKKAAKKLCQYGCFITIAALFNLYDIFTEKYFSGEYYLFVIVIFILSGMLMLLSAYGIYKTAYWGESVG